MHQQDQPYRSHQVTHHFLHAWRMFLDRLQDPSGPYDGRVEQILLGVGDIEMERRCRVNDGFEWRIRLDGFLESTFFRDVFNYHKIQFVFRSVGVCLLYLLYLLLRANGSNDRVSAELSARIRTYTCTR